MENNIQNLLTNLLHQMDLKKLALSELETLFLNHSKVRVRDETFVYYQRQFKTLNIFFKEFNIIYTEDINADTINQFIQYSRTFWSNSNNTINKRLEVLKMSFTYAFKQDLISKNPFDKIEKLKATETEIKIIEIEYVKRVITFLDELNNSKLNLKIKCFFYLLMETGARINELNHIEVDNINFDEQSILLTRTKTDRSRICFFTEKTKNALHNYIQSVKPEKYLFVNLHTGKQHDIRPYYKYIKFIRESVNIPDSVNISPHKWRHTYATNLIENGAPLFQVMKLMGHTDYRTTKKYEHISNKNLKESSIKYNTLLK